MVGSLGLGSSGFSAADTTATGAAVGAGEAERKREVEEFIEWEVDEKLADAEMTSLKGASSELFLKLMRRNFVKNSFQNTTLTCTYQDKTHTRELGQSILRELRNKVGKVVIIGPGSEPISEIASKCEELVLVDYNPDALRQAAKAVPAGTKVTLIQADLTGGLYQKISKGLAAWMSQSSQESLEPLIQEFSDFKPSFFEHPKLKDADLVVSAMVTSQLAYSGFEAVKFFKMMEPKESEKKSRSELENVSEKLKGDPELLRFANLLKSHTDHLLPMHHFHQMMQWGNKALFIDQTVGKFIVPYTDFSKTELASLVPLPYMDLFPKTVFAQVQKDYTLLKKQNWTWLYDPSTGKGFTITALSLTSKKTKT